MSNKSRTKGHNLERLIASIFRDRLQFQFAKTSRAASRLLDNCKIDIWGIPFNIQCKSGYDKSRPKYEKLYNEALVLLKDNYPPSDPVHNYPYVLIHKINERTKGRFTWTFRHEDILDILEDYYKTKQQNEELIARINELESS